MSDLGTGWTPTAAAARASVVAAAGLVAGALTGSPVLVVLAAPFLVPALMGLLGRPTSRPRATATLGATRLHEGQGSASTLHVADDDGIEQVTRVMARAAYVAMHPASGAVGVLWRDGGGAIDLGPRRWGRRAVGDEQVAMTSAWCGYRHGPVRLPAQQLTVWPQAAAYDSTAEAPQPDGLVGAHRSRRIGSGTEFAGIRPFAPGDRLRRISWPVSLRTRELQVVTTRAEQDASVLVVVDALRDIGVSGGVDGRASSLDLTVRAASALADHHVRRGDRVGMRVLGPGEARVPFGSGPRHLHRITGTLARVVPETGTLHDAPLELGVTGGCVVYVLSTMLHAPVVTACATLSARGVPVVVIDTLGERSSAEMGGATSPTGLAWRMRMIERATLLQQLAALGCPIVTWRGAGTVDEVLRQLSRRGQVPQVRSR
ncbi:DUF58 domain-containing protein [Nocardioides currus]|uniref:DUF58 domain-containing protein n=1 Tax=Nocardioides currus TaxID=2133958 RepID=A0A2R7Z067_9ACTN|nr:DUF58 domain-containing protein [Nocardioides currus]PUA82012.1 DUF58 domain-containing protein [Nocardioides currus]